MAAWLCSGCSQPGRLLGPPSQASDRSETGPVSVWFNHRRDARYRSPISGQWRDGDNLEALLITAIDAAEREIWIAVQELSRPTIAAALVRAKHRDLDVRLVLENNYSQPWSQQLRTHLPKHQRQRWDQLQALADQNQDGITTPDEAAQGDAIAILQNQRIPWIDDTEDGSRGSGLMHHKFVVIDRQVVITGSANFTASGLHGDANAPQTRGNVNHLLRLDSSELAGVFRTEFLRLWGDGPGGASDSRFGLNKTSTGATTVQVGDARVEVLFAPHRKRDPNHGLNWLEHQLNQAKRRIDLALFVFSAQQLSNLLQNKMDAGVAIRLVADPGFASRSFSEVLDLLGIALPDRDCKLEAGNQPFPSPLKGVGTPRLARGDKLHHKFAVIDNKTVITGSFNWSPSAAHTNDETLLVIHSPQLAKQFTREM
ncbi:MAG: phospholipase D-like domain-containing protein, partial [Synechococcus sp.]